MSAPRTLRRVYWETTAACNLRCLHCRRTDVLSKGDPDELTTEQGLRLIDDLAGLGKPVLIFSGGEPLYRRDIFELIGHAGRRGLPVAVATNGTLVDESMAGALRQAGVYYASVSLDGAEAATHDTMRGPGNWQRVRRGFLNMKNAGIKVQINYTVTRRNVREMEKMHALASSLGAHALYLFLLVPVGCGVQIADSQMLNAREVEEWLQWVVGKDRHGPLPVKAICAPHYFRIEHEFAGPEANGSDLSSRKGCLAGIHMCFISHKGDVFPCGYLPVSGGNVRRTSFRKIWEESPLLRELAEPERLEGRCGICAYKTVCGGCRARAYFAFGNIQAEEPYCQYHPAPSSTLAARRA